MAFSVTDAARSIIAMMRAQYSAPQTMVPADPTSFPHLDLPAYARFQAEMEKAGFRMVGDIEILELSNSPTTTVARTFIRNMLSADGRISCDYYQMKPRIGRQLAMLWRGLQNFRFYDAPRHFFTSMATRHCTGLESEFEDGRQLMTCNAQGAAQISGPPTIEATFFPYGAPVSVLLEHHGRRLADIAAGSASPTRPLAMGSMEDILAMQKRQHMQKVTHRASVQLISQDELRRMGGNQDVGDAIFTEVQRLLRAEHAVD